MSGPKGYLVSVFDSRLSEIFQLQSTIQTLLANFPEFKVCDKGRNIMFDCSDFTNLNQNQARQLISLFSINHSGIISQGIYDDYNKKISEKISKLNSFLNSLENEKKIFLNKQQDYHSFVSYEEYFQRVIDSFYSFRSQVVGYLASYLEKEYPELMKEAKNSIERVEIQTKKAEFEFGFRQIKEIKKDNINRDVKCCESEINEVRIKTSDQVINDITKINLNKASAGENLCLKGKDEAAKKINEKIKNIENIIAAVEDSHQRKTYQDKLENLIKSQTFKDEYYFTELFEDIKNAEQTNKWKAKIHQAIVRLNQIQVHENCRAEKAALLQTALVLTEKQGMKLYEFDDFKTKFKIFGDKNQKAIQSDLIKEKKRQYIKAQLVQSLKNLNYEVMNDMEVIDFEKESDFIFNIPNQSNYLNLRFNTDGSFLYNFLIPEKRAALSIDQKKQKLGEMESTCTEFKTLLKELAAMGLKTDLNKDMPISEKVLIQIPKKHQTIIQKRIEKAEDTKIEKARYFNWI